MSEEKLEKYYQRIDSHADLRINEHTKSRLTNYIFNDEQIKDPYKFAHINELDVEKTLQIFLFFVEGHNPPLLLKPFVDCQDLECKSIIQLEESKDDNISCLHCFTEYQRDKLKHLIKIRFTKNDDFFKPPYIISTHDILKRSDIGLKYSPVISATQTPYAKKTEITGTSLNQLSSLNQTNDGELISNRLSSIEESFSRKMEGFKIT